MKTATERNIELCIYLKDQHKDNKTGLFTCAFVYNTYYTHVHPENLRCYSSIINIIIQSDNSTLGKDLTKIS